MYNECYGELVKMSSKTENKLPRKQKRVTIKDISAAAGVSIRTVSLVMNNTGRISEATRKKVYKIMKKYNYQPNILARGLVNDKTYMFGVNIPYLDLSFINTIITGMEQKCIDLGYELLLTTMGVSDISFSDYNINLLNNSIERLIFRHVDGIACFPAEGALDHYKMILERGIPLIQLLRPIPALDCPTITVDNRKGMYLAAKYLLSEGRRHIGFLNYKGSQFSEVEERYAGFIGANEENGIDVDLKRYVVSCNLDYRGGYEGAKTLIERCPKLDAILSPTDYAAAGAVRACMDMNKKVPEKISIIGYDDMDFTQLQGYKSLSTVRQPKRQIGILAVDMLNRIIQGKKVSSIVLEPELVLRDTSAPKKTAK